jgi:putative NIF3 family GTP cyclohydrolase 1 type 2
VLIRRDDLDAAVAAMKKVHPYEEPAFDLYPLLNRGAIRGLGRIGDLASATTLSQFAQIVKDRLGASAVRYVGDKDRKVKRVALCGGSGTSLLHQAKFRGADLLVTGDVKYHEARDAEAMGVALMDAGHFCTERLMIRGVAARVEAECLQQGGEVEVVCFEGERDPFVYL